MAERQIMKDPEGVVPKFGTADEKQVAVIFARYPADRRNSAVMPILHLAQKAFGGWLSKEALDYVARVVGMAPIRVYEVATFYTMYNLHPVGKYHVQVCTNISCWLCSSDGIMESLSKKLKIQAGETTADGRFTLSEVECLGACVNAPMFQVNDDYYENLTAEKVEDIIERLP